MGKKEAQARIKINKLLEAAGWRFFDDQFGPANIRLELNVKITQHDIDSLGENFERTKNGFVDYLLLDEQNNPLVVLEAKKDTINPLYAKEQARKYANGLRAKYIILSNGDIHYFWNLQKGNPEIITTFPTYESLVDSRALNSSTQRLIDMCVDKYFIALSQDPALENSLIWKLHDEEKLQEYCKDKGIKILRCYQLNAIKSIQAAVKDKKTRFLFEMATGTGKTLTSAGVIKLFIRSEVANRVLFLVDRIELENQAKKDLTKYLSKDGIKVVVYKENKDDWINADVVISTIQSFSQDNKYKQIFSPSDFDLVVSDEAHRVLGASNRAIFEYFIGYKLGLTATPKNYLKGVDFDEDDPREIEKRLLLDTYQIFGCDSGTPTFSYTLNDGIKDKILVNPIVVDARSEISTKLLSDSGLTISSDDSNFELKYKDKDGKTDKVFTSKSFEKEFFSESTNEVFCRTFFENAERDPISNEIGKTIFFCVSIEHACKITQILNKLADEIYPSQYNSDFAIQITSNIPDSQQMTINFANNNLNGHSHFLDDYDTSKSRVAVTVGMMTTGYDCQDLLNVVFCRPIFSPADFIQMKGRGTRIFDFKYEDTIVRKTHFKLFDFFGVCEYFEEEFNYDEKIKLVSSSSSHHWATETIIDRPQIEKVFNMAGDRLSTYSEEQIGILGMKIDRKFYSSFSEKVSVDEKVKQYIEAKDEDGLAEYLQKEIFNKPIEFFTLDKIERALGLKRHLTFKEIAHNIIVGEETYKTRDEILEDEFENFLLINKAYFDSNPSIIPAIKEIFVAYLVDATIREAIKKKQFQILINSPLRMAVKHIKAEKIKNMTILEYIPYYVTTNSINCERFYA